MEYDITEKMLKRAIEVAQDEPHARVGLFVNSRSQIVNLLRVAQLMIEGNDTIHVATNTIKAVRGGTVKIYAVNKDANFHDISGCQFSHVFMVEECQRDSSDFTEYLASRIRSSHEFKFHPMALYGHVYKSTFEQY